jgi:chaperonin GroES
MNESGIHPQGDRVLVLVEELEETTEGGIVLPMAELKRHEQAQMAGKLVATGVDAWSDYAQPFASIGDRVMYARHGGIPVNGKDGRPYRLMNDVDITATLDDGVEFHDFKLPEKRKPLGAA